MEDGGQLAPLVCSELCAHPLLTRAQSQDNVVKVETSSFSDVLGLNIISVLCCTCSSSKSIGSRTFSFEKLSPVYVRKPKFALSRVC